MDTERIFAVKKIFNTLALFVLFMLASACSSVTGPGARSPTMILDDDKTESRANRDIKASDPRFASAHIVVVSHRGVVLLAGEVPSEDLKQKAGEVVEQMELVKSVHNELEVGPVTSLSKRSDDAWITTKVKSAMIAHGKIDVGLINVTTENGVVFLMGAVPQTQADVAVEVAQSVSGVKKIVKVFEYTN
jgi:osmotically-inducible protein OsmY